MDWLKTYLKNNEIVHQYTQGKNNFAHLSVLQESLLAIGATLNQSKPLFIVKENEQQAADLYAEIKRLNPDSRVVYYNHEESLRVEVIVQSEIMRANRIDALHKIITGDYDICITHAIASVRKLSHPQTLQEEIITLTVGQEIAPEVLAKKLHKMGYTRVKYVEQPFTYALRGGVCDVFSIQMNQPLRIEFFDVEIESMRSFDIDSQRSDAVHETATLVFANDVILNETEISEIVAAIDSRLAPIKDEELRNNVELKRETLLMGEYDATLYPFLGLWEGYATIYDYVKDAQRVLSPVESIERILSQNTLDVHEFVQEQYEMSEMLAIHDLYADFNPILKKSKLMLVHEYQIENEVHIPWHAANIVSDSIQETLKWIRKEAITQKVIIALDENTMEDFIRELLVAGIDYAILTDYPKKNGIYIDYSEISSGFFLEDDQIIVYTEKELYHYKKRMYRYDNKFLQAESLSQLQDLDTSDYVVHRQYGIGKYMGITTKEIEGVQKDFMRIMYRDGDELFVPLEQFSLVRKYMSSEATAVRLSKLGSATWQKNKDRIKQDVADVADKLVNLYSSRMDSVGYAFSPDNAYQLEFEEEFEYELTPDQKIAIAEIKKDMERPVPMDRLLIGDVGFGKTEVAIRAAFKAFVDNKQVVFLCPTTILSAQHTRTFKERFANFPIVVEVLNRFVSDKEQRDIIKRTREGKVDVLIGTHRVLSKDIKFKDLGLLIIDEEQRFGVEHKERIKEFKVSVDVLSLSATPIPRTLQMSLIGLRSLSQLNTPPSNRLPVMTYVIEKNEKTLQDIISKEINRGGQAFYLFNNVEHIYNVANHLAMNIESAKVAVIHGQMDRNDIEDVMLQFIRKDVNVLVCTTIIETGIDIPNANTMIVDNAHKFGLSQLYQIKGRVGRSDRLAYAYFVVPDKRNITEIAQKRLQAIKEFTQLGSGYKIAMRDLTIRGAGELLGGNQSGFIDTVGIDLYVQLLKEAIAQRQGKPITTPETEERLNLKIDGYLPSDFTSDDGEKLELYQEINDIETMEQLSAFYENIRDRYGKLPSSVTMLLEKTRLEIFLKDDRIKSFKERVNKVELIFTEAYSSQVDGVHLFELISDRSSEIKIKYMNQTIIITLPMYKDWAEDIIYILENLKENHNETR
ncbi:transcription-repair coupling factor [Erysipelothrix sp. HDW6C]|uniref:transcription-repair coupling factor n=1 Tax=Erysipelothrix sp. HDW6C TaxID=2714930 RepID=UPI001408DABB|nr:transcription-repair coupling factor [Erysipelothrix sp. HDW6C]QIK69075.1 transcription-repair coupling factor [Erysipelothrix sp. HDW6C]